MLLLKSGEVVSTLPTGASDSLPCGTAAKASPFEFPGGIAKESRELLFAAAETGELLLVDSVCLLDRGKASEIGEKLASGSQSSLR